MRKSYIVSMAIVMVALVGMMVAADMALKPMKANLALAADLTAMLEARGDIVPESKVLVLTRPATDRDLAPEGFGMVLEVAPSERVRKASGRLERLARRGVQEAKRLHAQGRGRPLTWIEVRFMEGEEVGHRVLFPVGEHGELGAPSPAVPDTWVASRG